MQNLSLIKTLPGDKNFHFFEELITKLYPTEIQKIKALEGINKTLLENAYVVLKDQEPLARCCLYRNVGLRYQSKKTFCFGNFECVNDFFVADYLFQSVIAQAKKSGAETLIGPMNGSTWDTYRLGKSSAFPLFFLEPYYPQYYFELLKKSGFSEIAKYISNKDSSPNLNLERIKTVENRFRENGITFRDIDLNQYENELKKLHGFCMSAFKNNFLFSPISEPDFISKYQKVKTFIKPEYVIIAEDKEEQIVGFIFCLENFNDKKDKGIIVKTLAKSNSVRYGGMGNLLGSMFKERARRKGYSYILHAFMLESNASRSLSEYFEGETIRKYYLFAISL